MCWDACKVPASCRLRTNCYRLPSWRRTRRLRRCRLRDAPAASAPARLFAKTAWRRLRSSTRGIAALDAAPRLETCCAPSARSRVRPRRWPKHSTGAWHVPFTRIRCRGSLKVQRRGRATPGAVSGRAAIRHRLTCPGRGARTLRRCVVRRRCGGVCARDCGGVSATRLRSYGGHRAPILRAVGCSVARRPR